jgi:hypothetical protein
MRLSKLRLGVTVNADSRLDVIELRHVAEAIGTRLEDLISRLS